MMTVVDGHLVQTCDENAAESFEYPQRKLNVSSFGYHVAQKKLVEYMHTLVVLYNYSYLCGFRRSDHLQLSVEISAKFHGNWEKTHFA